MLMNGNVIKSGSGYVILGIKLFQGVHALLFHILPFSFLVYVVLTTLSLIAAGISLKGNNCPLSY